MPRDGGGIYTRPFPPVESETTISSAVENGIMADLETDLNAARPIIAGGTGATTVAAARTSLQTERAMQVVTNYDSHVFEAGSFTSSGSSIPGAPAAGTFGGTALVIDANNIVLLASDVNNTLVRWVRRKVAGAWGTWVDTGGGKYVAKTGDTMTGILVGIRTRYIRTDGLYQVQYERTGTNARVYGLGVNSQGHLALDDVTGSTTPLTVTTAGNLASSVAPSTGTHLCNKTYVDSTLFAARDALEQQISALRARVAALEDAGAARVR